MFSLQLQSAVGEPTGKVFGSHWVEPTRRAVRTAAIEAWVSEANRIMRDAKRRTPKDTGDLRSTGHVRRDGATITMSFGGRAISGRVVRYAIFVHEITWRRHRVGEAKFLENAVNAARGGMESRVGTDVARKVSGRAFRLGKWAGR